MAESTSVSVVGAIVPSVKSEPVMPSEATQVEKEEEEGGGGGGGGDGEEATPPPPAPAQPTHQQQQLMTQLPAPPDAAESMEMDKDLLCPICMQIIKDAFLTSCGHSFCYMCIVTHLQNKSDCPCCAHFLTTNHLYPNFLPNKLLMKISAHQIEKTATPFEQLRQALQQTGMCGLS